MREQLWNSTCFTFFAWPSNSVYVDIKKLALEHQFQFAKKLQLAENVLHCEGEIGKQGDTLSHTQYCSFFVQNRKANSILKWQHWCINKSTHSDATTAHLSSDGPWTVNWQDRNLVKLGNGALQTATHPARRRKKTT